MANNLGVSSKSPTRYLGPGTNIIPIVSVDREPLPSDDKFPVAQFWIIGKNPKTGALPKTGSNGDIWYLERIEGENQAVWSQFSTGGVSATFWEYTADTTKQAEQNRGYVCDNATAVELTLPTSAEFGTLLSLTAEQGKWKLVQGAGQSVVFGDHQTTVGVVGYLESTAIGDSITLVCIEADTTWQAVDGAIGNISIDGTALNNALNEYSNRFEVGADAKGTATGTALLQVREEVNDGVGIYATNPSDGTDAYAFHAMVCGTTSVAGGYLAAIGDNYSVSPNPVGRAGYVIINANDGANGVQNRVGVSNMDFVWDYQLTNLMNLDTDAVLTVNEAIKAGDDVDSEDVEFIDSAGATGIRVIQGSDTRPGLTALTVRNNYENGTTSGSRLTVSTGVSGETSRVSGGIGAHSPNYTAIPNLAGRVSLYTDTPTEGLALAFTNTQDLIIGGTNVSSIFFKMNGTGERTMPLQPSCGVYLSSTQSGVTGNATEYTVPFNTELWDQGSNFNTGTYTFTAPVTGKYKVSTIIGVSGTNLGTTEFDIRFISSNRTWVLETLNPANVGTPSNNLRLNASTLIDMDTSDTLTIAVKGFNSGADDLNVLGAANTNTSVTIYLEH